MRRDREELKNRTPKVIIKMSGDVKNPTKEIIVPNEKKEEGK